MKVQYPGVGRRHRAPTCANVDLLGSVLTAAVPRARPGRWSPSSRPASARSSTTGSRPPTSSCSPTSTPATRSSTSPRSIDELSHRAGAHHRAGDRRAVGRAADVGPGREGPGRRGDLPLRVPQPLPPPRLQRRPAPGQLPVPAGGQVTFLDFGLVKHFDDGEMATFQSMIAPWCSTGRAPSSGAVGRGGRAAPPRRAGQHRGGRRYFGHFYEAVRTDAHDHVDAGVRRRPRCARPSTAPARSPQYATVPPTSSSSSASTSGCTPSSASSRHGQLPPDRRGAVADGGRPALDADGRGRAEWLAATHGARR